jgi:hypothetical protein
MEIRGVPPVALLKLAVRCHLRLDVRSVKDDRDGLPVVRCGLKTSGTGPDLRYGRIGVMRSRKTGKHRRLPGRVCWHGHRDFLKRVFNLVPSAVVRTSFATYRGETGPQGFLSLFPATYHSPAGQGFVFGELCDCAEDAPEILVSQDVPQGLRGF